MSAPLTIEELRRIDLFDDLSEDELHEWIPVSDRRPLAAGDILAEHGQRPPGVILLLEGSARAMIVDGERTEPLERQTAPTWMFAIAALTEGIVGIRMRAESDGEIAVIDLGEFRRLAFAQPSVHRRVMERVAPVLSRVTAREANRERLASLGEMAAGLAHELNNPAAAARRSADQLAEALDVISSALGRFVEAGIEREQAAELVALQQEVHAKACDVTALGALDAADAEDAVADRLEELGVSEPWRLAEPLAAAGVDAAWLDRVAKIAGEATDSAIGWVAATLTARSLATELQQSTEQMSKLVAQVKTYAYMDRGELLDVDIHEGIETTLAVLAHKLKHTEIEVARDYDRDLPRITVRGSELNQVWTNLIDNAIDALGGKGTITIKTRRDGDYALVAVSDNGPGIDPAIRERIFDSFTTTKDVGQGTGLGLATARRIVVDRHDGAITADSEPGRTTFLVRLPLTQT